MGVFFSKKPSDHFCHTFDFQALPSNHNNTESKASTLQAFEQQTKTMANKKPVVFLFQDDKKRVDDWVLSYPENETGGQIFGLWTHDRNPHINVITGPGKNCTHGSHSFHQDINYLKDVGTFLNTQFMMCHIGEWHSHHKLRLRQPSSGDLNSIWKHFPSGVEHFLLIIATIESDGVRLNPWLFTASTHTYDAIGNVNSICHVIFVY